MIKAVVFDYGGVLTTPVRESIAAWHAADGIDPASFTRAMKAWLGRNAEAGTPIHRLESGEITAAEFEQLLAAELTTVDGRPLEAVGMLERLFAGLGMDDAVLELAKDLRTAGIRTAILSNSWGNTYPRAELEPVFDPIVISGEVGLRKPDAAIFHLVLDGLGLPPEEVAFIDDGEPNVVGAEAVGMPALVHTNAADTRRKLAELIPALKEDA